MFSSSAKIGPTHTVRAICCLPDTVRSVALRFARKLAPYNRWGDKIVFDVDFYRAHQRLPGVSGLFNDELYRLFTTDEILNVERQFSCDKYLGKIFARGLLGEDISVPTLGVIDHVTDVADFHFPDNCVIKPTHSSGRIIFREGNAPVNRDEIRSWFSHNYYRQNREANYRYLKPRVIIEPRIFGNAPVDDLKVFCINGKAKIILFVADRRRNFARLAMSPDWEPLAVDLEPARSDSLSPPPRPKSLTRILEVAETLSAPFNIVRIDFFVNEDSLFLGEISHVHKRAMEKFRNIEEHQIFSGQLFK